MPVTLHGARSKMYCGPVFGRFGPFRSYPIVSIWLFSLSRSYLDRFGSLKPGFYIIDQVTPIVSIFSNISETTGSTQTTGTGLWFPYSRFGRLPRGCLVEVLNPTTIF